MKNGHMQKLQDFFCIDCNSGLCCQCLINEAGLHKGHVIRETEECYQEIIDEFHSRDSKMAVKTQSKKQQIKNQMDEVVNRMQRLHDETRMKEH